MYWWFLVTDTPWITFKIVPDPAPDTELDPVPGSAVVNSGKWYVQLYFSVRSKCSFSFNFSQTLKFCSDFVLKNHFMVWLSGYLRGIWEEVSTPIIADDPKSFATTTIIRALVRASPDVVFVARALNLIHPKDVRDLSKVRLHRVVSTGVTKHPGMENRFCHHINLIIRGALYLEEVRTFVMKIEGLPKIVL